MKGMRRNRRRLLIFNKDKAAFIKKEFFFKLLKYIKRIKINKVYVNKLQDLTNVFMLCDSKRVMLRSQYDTNNSSDIIKYYRKPKLLCTETSRGKGVYGNFHLTRMSLKKSIESGNLVGYAPVS